MILQIPAVELFGACRRFGRAVLYSAVLRRSPALKRYQITDAGAAAAAVTSDAAGRKNDHSINLDI